MKRTQRAREKKKKKKKKKKKREQRTLHAPPLELNNRRAAKVITELLALNGRTHQNHPQVRPLREHFPQDNQQKITVAVALVHLINDDVRQPL